VTDEKLEWQIGVFCHNERGRIGACLASISAAIGSRRARITVIVNGSTDGSVAAARAASAGIGTPVQIFSIPHADKSNAINCFLLDRRLRADASMYFFVDAYVTIARDAFSAMAARLAERPGAMAATGIAANGRTEPRSRQATVEVGGVMHGQLYALRPDFIARMVAGGIRLPIGLYRGDGLLGSMAAHDLDALGQPWLNSRLIGVPEATFEIDALSLFRVRDLRRQFRRKVRQTRGRLENEAIKSVIYTRGYAALPSFADDLIREFLAVHPMPRVPLPDHPFLVLAVRHLRTAARPDQESLQPTEIT
jgi:glycosyltransferase involved in cell wall biosynthesis